ncbi:MAG: sce7726 family protein [Patescibacteria group bacterium]|nr:sce7726 family protein [Patescibacteria group bacterium]
METQNFNKKIVSTNDHIIRIELRRRIEKELDEYRTQTGKQADIFEELGVSHGRARIDMAVINGVMHGYEIKSDKDTLSRLFDQIHEYNEVFDKITLVVGQRHLLDAIHRIPEWWGIDLAKIDSGQQVVFFTIREARQNEDAQVPVSLARMLWRTQALSILEERNAADGIRSKSRSVIHEKIAEVFKDDLDALKGHVMTALSSRESQRVVSPLASNGG